MDRIRIRDLLRQGQEQDREAAAAAVDWTSSCFSPLDGRESAIVQLWVRRSCATVVSRGDRCEEQTAISRPNSMTGS